MRYQRSKLRYAGRYRLPETPVGTRIILPRGYPREIRGQGGFLETHFRTQPRVPAGWSLIVRSSHIPCASTDNTQSKHAGRSHTRNAGSEPILRKRAGETRSGSFAAFVAGRNRPWIEAKFGSAAVQCRHSLGARTALGAIERALAAHNCSALCGPVGNKSQGTGHFVYGSGIQYPGVGSLFLL
jgi:hypothetical protein